MPRDKFTAVWVSHSSIRDFLVCPRAYYLKNVYKDPKTKHKLQIVSPPLSLGQAVHEVIESLSVIPTDQRFVEPLHLKFERAWAKVTGKRGGFVDVETERRYKDRGRAMTTRVTDHPGPLAKPAVKIKQSLPQFWLSEDDNIMLCGKIDWLEYNPETDSVNIVDFKSSRNVEDANSLQLPIYHLLAHYTQKRPVKKVFYWYLELSDKVEEQPLPDLVESQDKVLELAKQIQLARKLERYKCPQGEDGCFACRSFEAVLRGEAEFLGAGEQGKDLYILKHQTEHEMESTIL